MSILTTKTDAQVGNLIRQEFLKGLTQAPSDNVKKFFINVPAKSWEDDRKRIVEYDRERMSGVKPELGKTISRTSKSGYAKEIIRKVVAVKKSISGEQAKTLTALKLKGYAMDTASLIKDKVMTDMRNLFTYGDGVSYTDNYGYTVDTTTGDGKSMFNATHTLKHSDQTYSNIATGNPAFSEDALSDLETQFKNNQLTNYGDIVDVKPNVIFTTDDPRTVKQVARLLRSIAPATINGDKNDNSGVYNPDRARYQHLILNLDIDAFGQRDTSKSKYWGVASVGNGESKSLKAYFVQWDAPYVVSPTIDQDRWAIDYFARTAYGIGVLSAKEILISKHS